MDPSVYIPAYLERAYVASHPELTDAARELVHNDVSVNPHKYAQTEHAQALLSYAGVHRHLLDELHRIEDMGSDEEFEQTRNRLFDDMRDELLKIVRIDAYVLDAQLLAIILADTPVDACLGDLLKLEATAADYLQQSVPGFDMEAPHYWANKVLADGVTTAYLTASEPALIGWLHTLEAISQLCMASARYRAAANYARRVLTILLFKTNKMRPATRALREFANRCEGGAFFLLNPMYQTPYLPCRPEPHDPWDLSHQAVWEADGIISDTPDFAPWANACEDVSQLAQEFARRYGF